MDVAMQNNFFFSAKPSLPEPPEKPPDYGGTLHSQGVKVSFRDKMLADKHSVVREDMDFLANGLVEVDLIGGHSKTNAKLPNGESITSKEQDGVISTPTTSMHCATSSIDTQATVFDELHGEWLIVSRRKKVGKAGKGINAKDEAMIDYVFTKKRLRIGINEDVLKECVPTAITKGGSNCAMGNTTINGSLKSKINAATILHGKKGGSVLHNIQAGVKEGVNMGTSSSAMNAATKSGQGSFNAINSSLPGVHCTSSPIMQH
ncbi:unnamed protein product [Lupinus luteus]|uniref:Uncharacterized protein n=1 Tax=Lupinus luteus TaxID=3873 RepID=A0AAV1VRM0_LUPLU